MYGTSASPLVPTGPPYLLGLRDSAGRALVLRGVPAASRKGAPAAPAPGAGFDWRRLASAGFGWLASRISGGFRVDFG